MAKIKKVSYSSLQRCDENSQVDVLDPHVARGTPGIRHHRTEALTLRYTKDYDLFRLPANQRPANPAAIRRLRTSIAAIGLFIPENALMCNLANVDGEICLLVVDGQHRLEALRAENMEVPYFIVKLQPEAIHWLQEGAGKWSPDDYFNSHATAGNKDYRLILEKCKEYNVTLNDVGLFEVAYQNFGRISKSEYTKAVKNGTLKVLDPDQMDRWCQVLSRIAGHRKKTSVGGYGMKHALHKLVYHEDMTQDILDETIEKWGEHGDKVRAFDAPAAWEAMKNLVWSYNYKRQTKRWGFNKPHGSGGVIYSTRELSLMTPEMLALLDVK